MARCGLPGRHRRSTSNRSPTDPAAVDKAGDIWLNSLAPWDGLAPGSYGYSTLIHEMGHALGLKHPFEGAVMLPAQQESYAYSLMSYTAYAGSAGSWVDFEPTTPMLYDLLAIQSDVWRQSDHPKR